MLHFTYEQLNAPSQLYQGDLIKRTPTLEKILQEIHPHYFENSKNKFFVILTQSCDLVLRDGVCKSKYINLGVVRPFREVMIRELSKRQYKEVERKLKFVNEKEKTKVIHFIERLFNNNEPNYFFYYKEPSFGLFENHCAFLELSISLKAELHYTTLLDAKILQLTESFQHKLGSLVGSIYSRIGTKDWIQDEVYKSHVKSALDEADIVLWVENDIHKKLIKQLDGLTEEKHTTEILKDLIESIKNEKLKRRDDFIKKISSLLNEFNIDQQIIESVSKRIKNDPLLRQITKR